VYPVVKLEAPSIFKIMLVYDASSLQGTAKPETVAEPRPDTFQSLAS